MKQKKIKQKDKVGVGLGRSETWEEWELTWEE